MEIKKYLHRSCLIIIFFSLSACEKETLISVTDKPVVQAYLIPGKPVLVKVNMQRGLVDTASYGLPITGLNISINDGTNTITLQENAAGEYSHTNQTFISSGVTYSMIFSYMNKEVSAKTTIPEKPEKLSISETMIGVPQFNVGIDTLDTFVPVKISWENPNERDHFLIFKNDEQYPSSISNGSSFPGFGGSYRDIEANAGTATSFEIERRTFRYVGYYTLYLYTLNKEYVEILNAGSSSSLNLTNPVTNIQNGLGIFTGMNVDSLRVLVHEK